MTRPRFSTLVAAALVAIAALLLTTAVLMGRTGEPRDGKIVVTVRLWAEPIAAAYKQSFEAFTRAHPNIEVHTNLVAYSNYFDTLRTDVAGGSADDIFWLSNAYLDAYADSGRLLKIDTSQTADWDSAVVEQFTRKGALWGVPQLTDAGIAVFYNADLLAAAGVDPRELDTARWSLVFQQPQQTALAGRVQSSQRLVENQRTRRTGQQSGEHHAAHLAAAELVDAPLSEGWIQPDDAERRCHAVLVAVRKACCRSDFQVDTAAHQLQPGRLKRQRHGADLFVGGPAVKQTGAGGRNRQPRHDPGQRRFARPVATVNQHAVALFDDQVDVAQCRFRPWRSDVVFVADSDQFKRRSASLIAPRNGRLRRLGDLHHAGVVRRVAEIDDAVGRIGLVVVVGDVHQRGPVPFGQPRQHTQQRVSALLVDHGGDLVGDEDGRLSGQSGGKGEALQLPTGQASGVTFGESVQTHLAEQLIDVGLGARRQAPDHIVADASAQDLGFGVLQYDGGATQPAQTHGARPLDGAGRGLSTGQQQHQRRLARTVRAGDRHVFARLHFHAGLGQRVLAGAGIAEPDLVQPHRHRSDVGAHVTVDRRVKLVHVGNPAHAFQQPRQCPPADQRHDRNADGEVGEQPPRPVVQSGHEIPLDVFPDSGHADPGQEGRDALHVCGHDIEDEMPQAGQQRQ
ncbi:extracellular solute-binding protein [Mycobacterium kubicae]|uniref:Extracellular solute-binding protein n=1 Tax=Mycobacterium kubicae TaxID=120959 RepID=A0AAX1J406_9MYCO|nr:extracellular solute-binding protein [Mycobacterium kubicae]QPI36213.1 extracellular solute-binding protein [Mycobacterium kubicae]